MQQSRCQAKNCLFLLYREYMSIVKAFVVVISINFYPQNVHLNYFCKVGSMMDLVTHIGSIPLQRPMTLNICAALCKNNNKKELECGGERQFFFSEMKFRRALFAFHLSCLSLVAEKRSKNQGWRRLCEFVRGGFFTTFFSRIFVLFPNLFCPIQYFVLLACGEAHCGEAHCGDAHCTEKSEDKKKPYFLS